MKKILIILIAGLTSQVNAQWKQETFGKEWNLWSIHFPCPTVGYAVGWANGYSDGYGGLIIKYMNNIWDTLTCKTTSDLFSVYFSIIC